MSGKRSRSRHRAERAKQLLATTDDFLSRVLSTTRQADEAEQQVAKQVDPRLEQTTAALRAASERFEQAQAAGELDELQRRTRELEAEAERMLKRARDLEARSADPARLDEESSRTELARIELYLRELDLLIPEAERRAEAAVQKQDDQRARAFLAQKRQLEKHRLIARHHQALATRVLAALAARSSERADSS